MKWKIFTRRTQASASLLCVALAGCATYQPQPLPTAPDLSKVAALTVPAKQFLLPGLAPHRIPRRGLDEATVVLMAVCNDPDLKAARLQAGVAKAQMLEAGLLPNPQFGAGFAQSARNYGGVLSLSEDLQALITRGATKAAASAAQRKVHLNILWQEWQVAEQASQLFIQARSNEKLQPILQAEESLLAQRYQADLQAMRRGDQTANVVSLDLEQLSTAQSSLRQLEISINQTTHQLDALLGLKPGVSLRLLPSPSPSALSASQFQSAVADLPHRRADLLALRAGYQSQEEQVRKAILMQFPAMSAGLNLERDPVEGVNSFGPQVSLTLPIFNHNQGQIAIQRATRAVLRQTYQARLDTATNQAHEVWRGDHILAAQIRNLDTELPQLRNRAEAAKASLEQNNLDAAAYVAMETGYLAKREEAVRLRASLDSSRAVLHILLGLPLDR
ncbi:MAG: TolC family protein [Alphaproteobacteria bacterium]|nr:TolC family protein [Alphaproteobacteria bacterium]